MLGEAMAKPIDRELVVSTESIAEVGELAVSRSAVGWGKE